MLMQDRSGFVAGVANHRSIAWAIARVLDREGCRLAIGYLGEREKQEIDKLVGELGQAPLLVACDVGKDDSVAAAFETIGREMGRLDCLVHAIAFARREDLDGRYADTSREGYHLALDISAFSLNCLARGAADFKPPDVLHVIPRVPRTGIGKVQRVILRERVLKDLGISES